MRAVLTVDHDPRLVSLFAPEDKETPRASYTVSEDGAHVVFTVEAKDAVAMRALLNAILKLLTVWEQTENL